MSRPRTDVELEATLERYLAWRAERVAGAPDAAAVAATLDDLLIRAPARNGRPSRLRVASHVLVLLALALAIAAVALVGSRLTPEPSMFHGIPLSIEADSPCCGAGLAIAPDGSLVHAQLIGGRLRLTRFDADGQLDRSFGTDGILWFEGAWLRTIIGLAFQPDGQVIVLRTAGDEAYRLTRHRPDGTTDATFGESGHVSFELTGAHTLASQVVVSPDGEILVVGATGDRSRTSTPGQMTPTDPEARRFALLRFRSDGYVDESLGGTGQVAINVGAGRDTAYAVAVQQDGRMVLVGETGYMTPGPDDNNIAALRLLADGSRDMSFGDDGVVTTHIEGTLNSSAGGVALGPDDTVVVIGRGPSPGAVVRYMGDGSLDPSFAGDETLAGRAPGYPFDAVVLADGRVVLAGTERLVRLTAGGEIDQTFGSDGWAELP